VEGGAARLGQDRPLNGPQDLQDVIVSLWSWLERERADDHVDRGNARFVPRHVATCP